MAEMSSCKSIGFYYQIASTNIYLKEKNNKYSCYYTQTKSVFIRPNRLIRVSVYNPSFSSIK